MFTLSRPSGIVVPILALLILLVLALGWRFWSADHSQPVMFEDVTVGSGLNSRGMTFGVAWGDYDADGLPDVYLGNHINKGQLFRNLGKGRFVDVTEKRLPKEPPGADKHGALWADFDNDGDQDLLVLRGGGGGVGAEANLLFVNEGGDFEEQADGFGLSNPKSRTRMPLWFDADRDGRLDLFMGAFKRTDGLAPAAVFMQRQAGFAEYPDAIGLGSQSSTFCILGEVDRDRFADIVCRVYEVPGKTAQIFSTAAFPLDEIAPFPATHFDDIVAADFDGDASLDLYLARRSAPSPSKAPVLLGRRGSNEVLADVWVAGRKNDAGLGFAVETSGELEVTVFDAVPRHLLTPDQIRIGRGLLAPTEKEFILSREVAGLGESAPEDNPSAVRIDHEDHTNEWVFTITRADSDSTKYQRFTLRVVTNEPISDARVLDNETETSSAPDRLFINQGDGWSEESARRGLNEPPVEAVNIAAGDFDNDMDVDLYLVVSGILANSTNRLLLNRGDGTFEVAAGSGGASGGRRGVGDSATVVDFDQDGFLDLLIANGSSMDRSFGLPAVGGDYRLYRNKGNNNNWIKINLEGKQSNRDGIGALVYVSAGGKRQVRLQNGGVHNRGQNHQQLHFGLAGHARVDAIEVHWPSGVMQHLSNIPVNQILSIVES